MCFDCVVYIFVYVYVVDILHSFQANDGKKKRESLTDSLLGLSKSVSEMIASRSSTQYQTNQTPMKFENILRNLDDMFQKMEERDVHELNAKFVAIALDK